MSAYINIRTLEYPRHAGDLALDPEGEYAPVAWVDPPEHDTSTQIAYEGSPAQVGEAWSMTWLLRDVTEADLAVPEILQLSDVTGDTTAPGAAPDVID